MREWKSLKMFSCQNMWLIIFLHMFYEPNCSKDLLQFTQCSFIIGILFKVISIHLYAMLNTPCVSSCEWTSACFSVLLICNAVLDSLCISPCEWISASCFSGVLLCHDVQNTLWISFPPCEWTSACWKYYTLFYSFYKKLFHQKMYLGHLFLS